MTEIEWKWINMINEKGVEFDYTNMYKIYIDGRVESMKRRGCKQNRFLNGATNKDDYKRIDLSKDNKRKTYLIHRIIAIHFIPNPHNFPEVDHINQEKDDNRIDNLRWSSRATNMRNQTKKRKCDLPRGVTIRPSGKYEVRISINNKDKYLGQYDTIKEASCVYEEARLEQITKELNNFSI